MEDIKVGEYVRTKDGIIGKVFEEDDIGDKGVCIDNLFFDDYAEITDFVYYENILKHSMLISEVVEVGDYVNGKLIHKIDKGPNYCYLYYGNCKTFVDYQIQTILTKEQFEANCYKVGGKDE